MPLSLRADAGTLFENWFVVERLKRADNRRLHAAFYFWRTYDQKEIDLVEEREGRLTGYDCKWSPAAKANPPREWSEAYPDAGFVVVNRENWRELLEDDGPSAPAEGPLATCQER